MLHDDLETVCLCGLKTWALFTEEPRHLIQLPLDADTSVLNFIDMCKCTLGCECSKLFHNIYWLGDQGLDFTAVRRNSLVDANTTYCPKLPSRLPGGKVCCALPQLVNFGLQSLMFFQLSRIARLFCQAARPLLREGDAVVRHPEWSTVGKSSTQVLGVSPGL